MALARDLGLSLAYVPSMRNGSSADVRLRADRGNAILSTEPIEDVAAVELPFGKQRRVAVAATIRLRDWTGPPLRLVSFHLDTNGTRVRQAEALAGYLRALTDDYTVIAGGDLNSFHGQRDRAFAPLDSALGVEPCGTRQTHTWPFRLDRLAFFRGRIDFLFGFRPGSLDRTCRTLSSGAGSDHRPVVMTIG